MNNQVANTQQITVKQFVNMNSTKKRFEDVLGKRASQFMSSLVSVVNSNQNLQHVDAGSVINSALVAAALDLPINPSLGYMYIVPYKGQAQPQMGYKGYIQLAQRSGQYKHLNAIAVYADEFQGWNPLTEEIDYQPNFHDRNGEQPVGYLGYLELLNGFQKTVYWTREQVDNHRKRFSKMSGGNTPKGVWKDNFDAMALKTVLRNLLTKWGPMTVDMQTAYNADEEEHDEMPRDVTPEQTEDNAQVQSLINSYNEAQQEQQTTKKAAKPAKATKTASKGAKVDDNNVQEELLNDGTITPKSK